MEYRKAFMKYVCRGEALPKEYRVDAVSKSTDVGAVIPTTVLNQIVEKLESTGMILALVTRTAYKGGVSIPVSTVKPTARQSLVLTMLRNNLESHTTHLKCAYLYQ